MAFDPAERPLSERVAGWQNLANGGVRVAVVAVAALMLTYAGALGLGFMPWGALALPTGLALTAWRRWGRSAGLGTAAAVALALLGMSQPLPVALFGALLVAVGAALGVALMRRLRFDTRLERASDVAVLAAAVVFGAATPVALGLAAAAQLWPAWVGPGLPAEWVRRSPDPGLLGGWCVLALGGLATAVASLAFDRSVLHTLQRGTPGGRGGGGAVVLLLLMAWLAWAAPGAPAPVAALALFFPLVAVTWLALREQLAFGAFGLLLAGVNAGASAQLAVSAMPAFVSSAELHSWLAAWFACALTLMLLAHATVVEWRSRSQRWEWALDGSRLGVADWHLQRNESFASAAWRTLTGHTQRVWSTQAWQAQVHPDERESLAAAIAALSAGEVGRREIELRLPSPHSPTNWRWAEATLMVIERDSSGHPLRLLATLADVQERREAMERQRMSAALFQHLHEGLLITDPDLHALDVNPAYTQILGVPREELIGTVPSLLRPAAADPVARQQRAAMWASLRDHGSWRGELLERRRNGETCVLQATISTVHGPAAGGDNSASTLRYHVLVISDITEQQAQRDQLERQAHFDELTRLPNRAHLSQLLDDAMRAADRDGYLLVVCYLDLDHFKPVNDRFGHAAGDRLLAELAGRLRSALRSREHWTDSAARLGGDEFVLLLRAGTLEEGRLAVERVLRVVSQPYLIDPAQEPVQVTASMGATVYPVDRSDADTLLRHADHAMYDAKQSGRNGYLFFDPEHRRRAEQRVMAIGRIQEALDQQEFVLFYQPKVDMKSGRVLGFEALLRWEHPQQGLVAPLQFLPLIENTGLSSRVGDWVIARALEHLSNWRRDGLDISVSVNVSARHLQEPDFALRLSELLARHTEVESLAPHLELEMLETAAHADIEATSALLAQCQGTGVRFALDDFGTGYSTLTYLKRLPVDVLKIDRSFVHHMLDDAQDRAIVEGVIGLARTFGCTVVAEGVESPAQARTLLDLGCDIGQGTGIAAPMPAAQVAQWVREYKGMFALVPADTLPPTQAAGHGSKGR